MGAFSLIVVINLLNRGKMRKVNEILPSALLSRVIWMMLVLISNCDASNSVQTINTASLYSIDGRALMPGVPASEWIGSAKINVNGDAYHGFFRSDGSFTVTNVPSGSYIVEIVSTKFVFPPVRVDITSKGKKRARKLDLISPNVVEEEYYPLKIKALGPAVYIKQREQFRVQDALMNPMVLMVVLPFLLMMVIPKLINTDDPERKQEMQETMQMFNTNQNQLPDMAEMFTNWFGAGSNPTGNKRQTAGSSSAAAKAKSRKITSK